MAQLFLNIFFSILIAKICAVIFEKKIRINTEVACQLFPVCCGVVYLFVCSLLKVFVCHCLCLYLKPAKTN